MLHHYSGVPKYSQRFLVFPASHLAPHALRAALQSPRGTSRQRLAAGRSQASPVGDPHPGGAREGPGGEGARLPLRHRTPGLVRGIAGLFADRQGLIRLATLLTAAFSGIRLFNAGFIYYLSWYRVGVFV